MVFVISKIGDRIAHLRKVKGISQTDLATSIKASREAVGKYERNEAMPSVETEKKIADVFEVTLDSLVDDTAHASLDKLTVKCLKDIEYLSEDDRKTLFAIIDAFLRDAKARKAYS